MNTIWRRCAAVMIWTMACVHPASAAGPGTRQSVADIALYEGADRHARLVEAARKEGQVSVYHTWATRDMQPVFAAFTQKYGIPVKPWRAGSEAVVQRIVNEARAGRFDVDIVQSPAPDAEALHRENLLQEVRSPYLKELLPQALAPHKEWVGVAVSLWVAAYNTSKVSKEELPKTYQDLLDPKWKGRLGIEMGNHAWFGTLAEAMGEQQALKLFSDIVATNGISPRKGHSALAGLVASGEVPLALTVYHYMSDELKQKGAPIDSFVLQPAIGLLGPIAMMRQAPHPNAAVLFYDFMVNEGQAILGSRGLIPTSSKIDSPIASLPLTFVDPARILDMNDKWQKTWDEIMLKKAGPTQ